MRIQKRIQMKRFMVFSVCLLFTFGSVVGCRAAAAGNERIPVRVLIIPKFEVGELSGDTPGEAQYYYEEYLEGGREFTVPGTLGDIRVYEKDGIVLFMPGMGKVDAALGTLAVLKDDRFDFSKTCIISTGCAGSSVGYGTLGDVFIITTAVDYDLGHHADIRDMAADHKEAGTIEDKRTTWFHHEPFDELAVVRLNADLTDRVYEMVKDIPLETTEQTRECLRKNYHDADWAVRDPRVLKGTTVTGDNYWKGEHGHNNAVLMVETYDCPDEYAITEMEDLAVAKAVRQMGLLDHFLIIRDSVNLDVFMGNATPESLWASESASKSLSSEDSEEAVDIFPTAMKNNFEVGRVVIDAVLNGELEMA